jgi:hypothetical protein
MAAGGAKNMYVTEGDTKFTPKKTINGTELHEVP